MKLSESEIKALFAPLVESGKLPSISHYLSIDTNANEWLAAFTRATAHIDDNSLISIYLGTTSKKSNQHAILMVAKLKDIKQFKQNIDGHLSPQCDGPSLLDALKIEWKKDPSSYIFTLFFRIDIKANLLVICYRATAPDYQRRGIMKALSLAFLAKAYQTYGDELEINAYTVHPATYLFFNPKDRQLQSFEWDKFHCINCRELLEMHHVLPKHTADSDQTDSVAVEVQQISYQLKKISLLTLFKPKISDTLLEENNTGLTLPEAEAAKETFRA